MRQIHAEHQHSRSAHAASPEVFQSITIKHKSWIPSGAGQCSHATGSRPCNARTKSHGQTLTVCVFSSSQCFDLAPAAHLLI